MQVFPFTIGGRDCNLWLKSPSVSNLLCRLKHIERDPTSVVLLEVLGTKGVVKSNGSVQRKNKTVIIKAGDELVFSSSGKDAYIFQLLMNTKLTTSIAPSSLIEYHGESTMDKDEVFSNDNESDEETTKDSQFNTKKKGWFSFMFQSIAGKANLEKSDVEPAFKALKDRLMTKNVAEEIAEKLRESVAASLEGKKLASFSRISSTVQTAMEEALTRILTPKCSIDILRDVHFAKDQDKPYVVVFVGVNGVGKSTNLEKVAYWLLQHDVSVMIAACDTFRSGVVNQLRTPGRLQIPIFEKGYKKDPAIVIKEAIQEASSRNGSDVVLVDAAGRMQDMWLLS